MKVFLILIFTLVSCDFSTGVSRRILKAQKFVNTYHYDEALKEYHQLVKLNIPEKVKHKIYYQIAEIYNLYLMDKKKALFYYDKVNDHYVDEKLRSITLKKATILSFELRDFSRVIKYYRYFLENKKVSSKEKNFYEFEIARSYFEMNQWDKAKEIFLLILKNSKNPYHARSLFYLGQIASYEKKDDLAISYWKTALKSEKKTQLETELKFYLANLYEHKQDLDNAYKYYYSIIESYPNPNVIKKRLEGVYNRKVSRRR